MTLGISLALCLGLATGCAAPGATTPAVEPVREPSPGPALWSMADDDSTIYLFGTVHLLRPDTQWLTPPVEVAWQEAQTVYMEADTDSAEVQAELAGLMQRLGVYSDGTTLLSRLDPAQTATVKAASDALQVPLAALAPLKPWLAGLQLSVMQLVKAGYDPASGVETVLNRDPLIADKRRRYFETAAQQIEFFETLTEADQVAMLVAGARAVIEEPDALDALVEAWSAGDVKELARLMSSVDAFGSEAVYELLLTDRNRAWLPKIEALLDEPGVHLIAVGAGHLAGEDSVVALLRARGYRVQRR
jgi:uncharacterized protein YbaP (TraB family)